MTLDKESRIYRKALLRGVGECVTMLTTETARRKFRPLVEWACGRALGYDPQIEDSVLAFNYREEDDDILISASQKLGGLCHDALAALARLAERNSGVRLSNRMLSHLYDLLYCTCCRERCVREMGRRGLLTNKMLNDCLHDASVEIRCYAARLLKRWAAHNTERSNP